MSSPEVSAILPAYNEERWISDSINSVLAQTFEDFEVVVVDDGSTDRTPEIVREYEDPRVELYQQENAGSAAARNMAIEHSSGEYIAIIDADDVWYPEKLDQQLSFMREAEIEFSYTNMRLVDGNGNELGVRHETPPPEQTDRQEFMRRLFMNNFVCHPSVVFHRSAVANRRFDERFPVVNDHDLYLRIASEHEVGYVDDILVRKRYHGGNISGSQNYEQLYEERRQFIEKIVNQFPFLEALEDKKRSQINLTYGINLIIDGHTERGREALRRSIAFDPINWKSYATYALSFGGSGLVRSLSQQR